MRSSTAIALPVIAAASAAALECSPAAFAPYLPSNANVVFAYPVAGNSTFNVPVSDIGYPVSPTELNALCALQVNVTSSNSSNYNFGMFLPTEWNKRFLLVTSPPVPPIT